MGWAASTRAAMTLAVAAGLLAAPFPAAGAPAAAPADPPLHFERLAPEHGLPHNTVNDLLQDRRGFLWVATDGGVARWDGVEFVEHRIDPASGAGNVMMGLLEDADGRLWVGAESGLWRLDRGAGSLVAATREPGSRPLEGFSQALLEDRSGSVWAGVGDGLYRTGSSGAFRRVEVPGPPFERLWSLEEDPDGELWVVVSDADGLEPELRSLGRRPGPPVRAAIDERFHVLVRIDSTGGFWLGPSAGAEALGIRRREAPGVESYLNDLVELPDGTFWLASATGLFHHDPQRGTVRRHPLGAEARSWQTEQVRSLLADATGGLWAGTLGGLFHHDPLRPRFGHWGHRPDDPSTLGAGPVSDIEAADGALWVSTFGGGVDRVDPAGHRTASFRHHPGDSASLPADSVWAMKRDGLGRLWTGTRPPAFLDPRRGGFTRLPLQVADGSSGAGGGVVDLETTPGRVWLATMFQGLYAYRPGDGGWDHFPELDGLALATDDGAPGRVWVGRIGAVARVEAATLEVASLPLRGTDGRPLPHVSVFDLHPDGERLWLGTTAGLARLDLATGRSELPIAAGELPGTVVFSIQPDDRGRLWLGTNQGLARFDPALPAERRVSVYDSRDGVGNVEFNRHARHRSADGTIHLGGMSGVTVFHPDEIRADPFPPPVVVTAARTLGPEGEERRVPRSGQELTVPAGAAEVTFSFTAPSFTRAERTRFAYRLEGFDPSWIDAGTERSARYTNVPPGSYRFRVQAANADGMWNRSGASLPVVVEPHLWQTLWFRLLAAAALVALGVAAYRLRVRRLIEVERMRLRIAGDLHDELGSELAGIALASARLARSEELDPADRRRLEEVRSAAVNVAQGLRDVVWTVDPEHDDARSLEARMRSAAATLLGGIDHHFAVDLPPEGLGMDMATRRDLYLIFREAATNAARHAGAERVEIRLELADGRLELEVADDGRGFDPAAATDGSGLASLRRRTARLGGELEIDGRPGAGTRVRLALRIRRRR